MDEKEKSAKSFARWIILQTSDVQNTLGPCRLYNNKILNIDECYEEYSKLQKTIEVITQKF